MANAFQKLLKKVLIGDVQEVPVQALDQIKDPKLSPTANNLNQDQMAKLRNMGVYITNFGDMMTQATIVNFDRRIIYQDVERALMHPIMAGATELYAGTVSNYNRQNNASVWITSDNSEYRVQLEELMNLIGIEEKIYDWTWNVAAMGDLMVRVKATPGIGIVSIDDNEHPINISRLDVDGRLVGFFETPSGISGSSSQTTVPLLPPWEYVHFRLLGVKKKRTVYSDPRYSDYKTFSLLSPEIRQISSKYGTSVLLNALPTYKRLRLAEDSIMLARLSRSQLSWIFKVKVDGANIEAVDTLLEEYKTLLTRKKVMDTSNTNPNFGDRFDPMVSLENIIVPVWGDVNNLSVEKMGGEVDIKWIADIEELRNQLAIALCVPLQLLGGYMSEAPGSMSGKSSLENMDVRFSRNARRLQRAVVEGIKRLCQIHLAYKNMNPSEDLFEVHMSETSTAEETEQVDNTSKAMDLVNGFMDSAEKFAPALDKKELFKYLNTKFLKLSDLDVDRVFPSIPSSAPQMPAMPDQESSPMSTVGEPTREAKDKEKVAQKILESMKVESQGRVHNTDLISFLPYGEKHKLWEEKYKDVKIIIKGDSKT